ncbi:hypothetical protein ACPVPU_14815 [Sphingomonas sp. CJ99]
MEDQAMAVKQGTADHGVVGIMGWRGWRWLGWGAVAAVLIAPTIAMRFTDEVNWTASDYGFAIVVLGGIGVALELVVRASGNWALRAGTAIALLVTLAIVWINGAVGIIGDGDHWANFFHMLAPPVALSGAALGRFRARGVAVGLMAAALVQLVGAVFAAMIEPRVIPFIALCITGWLVAAGLFRRAAQG